MIRRLFISVMVLVVFAACAARDRVTGIGNTYLSDVDVSKKLPNLPFEHSWVWVQVDRYAYEALYIKPIRTDTLPKGAWQKSMSAFITSEEDFGREAQAIARYFREQIIEKIRTYPNARFKIADRPGAGVGVVDIALTELEFLHPVARAGSLAVPVPGTGAALSTVTDPHAAFAMRINDGGTGKLIATVADRKFPPTRILDLNKLTVTSSIREVCQIWADTIAEAFQKGRFGRVNEKGTFELVPW